MSQKTIEEIADDLAFLALNNNHGKPKQLKVKTLLSNFGYKKRTEDCALKITKLLAERNVILSPSIMKLSNSWSLKLDDRVYLLKRTNDANKAENSSEINLIYDYKNDSWFNDILAKEFLTEKEVENKFIIPLLNRLGYEEDDRYDGMPIKANNGSRSMTLEVDFGLKDTKNKNIENQTLLIVEAKKEGKLSKSTDLENAKNQLKSYAFWSSCNFGLLTDSKLIQVIGFSQSNIGMEIIFECTREELKNNFTNLYKLISKNSLSKYHEILIQ